MDIISNFIQEKSDQEILENSKKSVLQVSNLNLIIFSSMSIMSLNSKDELLKVQTTYFDEQYHDSLYSYISSNKIRKETSQENLYYNAPAKLIVYTYSNILEEIISFTIAL